MFDFPNAPVVGQQVTEPNGAVVQWDGVKWANATGPNAYSPTLNNVGRNYINNSMFNVQQRGPGQWTLNGYTADQWAQFVSNDSLATNVVAMDDGRRAQIGDEEAKYGLASAVVGTSAAGALTFIYQQIEDARRLANKTVTISLWAYVSSGTAKVGVGLRQGMGTGGSPSSDVDVIAISIQLTTTPTRYSVTLTLPSLSGKTLGTNNNSMTRLGLYLSSGANTNSIAGGVGVQSATFVFYGVQLELGSTATPLEKLQIVDDRIRCQRHFQTARIYGQYYHVAGGAMAVSLGLPVLMRAAPTLAITNQQSGNITGPAVSMYNASTIYQVGTATAAGTVVTDVSVTCTAEL
jgi:hypothetical protein